MSVMPSAAMWTKHVAIGSAGTSTDEQTWLKDDLAAQLHIASVTRGFDTGLAAQHGTDNEGGAFADPVKGPKFERSCLQCHG